MCLAPSTTLTLPGSQLSPHSLLTLFPITPPPQEEFTSSASFILFGDIDGNKRHLPSLLIPDMGVYSLAVEGANRLQIFGPHKLEEKKESKVLKLLGFMWNPLSWAMEATALMAIMLTNGNHLPPDWQDFVGIMVLLVINSTISFIEGNNVGNEVWLFMANLAPRTKVLRDAQWAEQEATILVPGDIISIMLGDIVLADARLIAGDPLKIVK